MKAFTLAAIITSLLLADPALAFRCGNRLVREGDLQAKVRQFCGEPAASTRTVLYRHEFSAPWRALHLSNADTRLSAGTGRRHQHLTVEILVEEWTYNFGPHRLLRVVRFEDGAVATTRHEGYGWQE